MQELAESQSMTYQLVPSDIAAMTKIGPHGLSPQNCEREFRALFGVNLKSPSKTSIRLSVLRKVEGIWVSLFEDVDVFAPHDWFAAIAEQGLLDKLFGSPMQVHDFGNQVQDDDPKFHNNPTRKVRDWRNVVCNRVPWRCCTAPKE